MIEPALNQYAPPTAMVADVAAEHEGTSELNYFSANGRVGRLRYLAYVTGASLIHAVVAGLLTLVFRGSVLAIVVNTALYLALFAFTIVTGIKRCHDMNISGWWSATFFIPLIGLAWIFWPGTQGPNRFGPPPPANTTGVRVLALVLPVIFVIGVLAAISIPAYMNYMKKAQAPQQASQQQP
ncbi:Uncharacterized membrane protein YhaH, DUF805 family [Roseateles sp. YR242]|uniref:DUF805 domain-containing protein n=1 Tax=Roseateles sp. YR242 TaxID=1855305 RepID=UPI0008B3CCC9|nr:DUF805 domain-containing protein [Roseateles sp. YR242]SEK62389.1 Uncharacterized membrane protein YhaH, DUF805 family [Roseateles sp. YR242]